jgi:tetratricopeptide (TPR) repeat protein
MPLYYLALANDASKKGMPETLELLQTYSHRHPGQFWPLHFLGHASFQTARTSQSPSDLRYAESLTKKSVGLQGSYADSHLDLGNVYFQQELWKEAMKEYEKAISLQPDLIQAYFKLYGAYLQVGDSAQAQREKNIRQRLQQQETERGARQRQVSIFLYKLQN